MSTTTLAGVRILDLTSYLAGPYGATLLGDLGADVIKVEAPIGDAMRQYPSSLPEESRAFLGGNRNKRAMVIDLTSAGGREVFLTLVERADVVIQNFRPGVAKKLGVDFASLSKRNPRIVFCALTGFGQSGPMAGHAGFDQVLQAMTGVAHAQGADEGEPHIVWGSVVDFYAAALVALSVSAALYNREKTGRAQEIDASLLRSALAMQAGRMVWAEKESREVQRDLKPGRLAGIHPTKEGYLYLQAQTPKFWEALCELTGLQELARDPRYDTMRKRKELEHEVVPRLRAALAKRTALEWEQLFGSNVPCAAVRTIEDMFEHPQVLAQELVATHDHPEVGRYRSMTGPVRMYGGADDQPDRRAPMLGEHTDEILREHGFDDAAIARLRAERSVQ